MPSGAAHGHQSLVGRRARRGTPCRSLNLTDPEFRVEHEVPAVAGCASAMTAAASNMLKANASRFVKVFSFNSVCPARYCAGQ